MGRNLNNTMIQASLQSPTNPASSPIARPARVLTRAPKTPAQTKNTDTSSFDGDLEAQVVKAARPTSAAQVGAGLRSAAKSTGTFIAENSFSALVLTGTLGGVATGVTLTCKFAHFKGPADKGMAIFGGAVAGALFGFVGSVLLAPIGSKISSSSHGSSPHTSSSYQGNDMAMSVYAYDG